MPDFASQGESPWFGPARDLANFGGVVKICLAYAYDMQIATKMPHKCPFGPLWTLFGPLSGISRAYA